MRGNTMANPKFLDDSRLKQFDIVVDQPDVEPGQLRPESYENDSYERFESRGGCAELRVPTGHGYSTWSVAQGDGPRRRRHRYRSREPGQREPRREQGKGDPALVRGARPDRRRDPSSRQPLLQHTAAGLILLFNRAKPEVRRGQLLLVNASGEFKKGKPKNELTDEGIRRVVACFSEWADREGLCRVVEQNLIEAADYNFSPARFVRTTVAAESGNIQGILDELARLRVVSGGLDASLCRDFERLGFQWEAK